MSTAVSVLKRAPLSVVNVPGANELLEEAARLVGYRPKHVRNRAALEEQARNEQILAQALTEAELQPLTRASVEAYKARLVRETESKSSCKFVRVMHGETGEALAVLLGLLAWGWFFVQNVAFGVSSYTAAIWLGHLQSYLAIASYTLLAFWFVCMFARHKRAIEVRASWNSGNNVDCYYKPIPEFAIADMLALKKTLPDTTFFIQEFQTERNDLRIFKTPVADPFLVANYKGVCVYLDVWDEPLFEGRRTV